MKRILPVLLTVCLLVALFAAFAVGTSAAEDIEVTVGQKFEWNYQGADSASQKAWRLSGGVSPDKLWKYMFYSLDKNVYGPVVLSSDGYAWAKSPGNTGIGYARARDFGQNFHPGEKADIVKVFTCPSGGTVTLDTSIARVTAWVAGKNTASSLSIFLEDQLIYPEGGGYLSVVSDVAQDVSVDIDVKKGERIFIHIGCIDGDQTGDAVIMSNTVTYKSVNDVVNDNISDKTLSDFTRVTADVSLDPISDDTADSDKTGGIQRPVEEDEGGSVGLIIAIVAAVVVVVAVVVVIVIKKKKQ